MNYLRIVLWALVMAVWTFVVWYLAFNAGYKDGHERAEWVSLEGGDIRIPNSEEIRSVNVSLRNRYSQYLNVRIYVLPGTGGVDIHMLALGRRSAYPPFEEVKGFVEKELYGIELVGRESK